MFNLRDQTEKYPSPFLLHLSLFFFLPEGEQEEAWLTEAGLARLFDDSLATDQDQVSIVYPLFN